MKKKLIIIMLVILAALLCACGAKEKTVSEVLVDIQNQDGYYERFGIEIISSDVIKRQTNKDDKTDLIWVSTAGEGKDFRYFAEYQLTYVLYNEGWILEEFDEIDSRYEAKEEPIIEEVEIELSEKYENCTLLSTEKESPNDYEYLFLGELEISEVLYAQYELNVSAHFSLNDGWHFSLTETEKELFWDLNGVWTYSDEDIEITAVVSDFQEGDYYEHRSGNEYVLTLEYICKTKNATLQSGGTMEYYLQDDFGWDSDPYYLVELYDSYEPFGGFVSIDVAGVATKNFRNTNGTGLFFYVNDGEESYYQYLTRG